MRGLSLRSLAVVLCALIVLALAPSHVYAQQYSLRLAHVFPATPEQPPHAASLKFAELVSKDSNGRIKIEVHGGGVLGGERAISEQVTLGGIQMGLIGVGTQSHLSQQLSIEELPYAWDNLEQIVDAYNGDLGKALRAIIMDKGKMDSLAFWPLGFRHLTNNVRPVRVPADVVGLKLRVAEVPLRVDIFRQLKAQVVPMAFPELFMALQQGTVDGQENPLFIIRDSRFSEVQKHLSLTGHIANIVQLVVNHSYYQKLPKDIQQILSNNARKMQEYFLALVKADDSKALETLKKQGMTVIEDVDKAEFRRTMRPVYDKYKKVFQADLWAAMEKYSAIGVK